MLGEATERGIMTDQTKDQTSRQTVYMAGGCFWGMQEYLRRIDGVLATEVGYAQSQVADPSYEEVCSGATDAVETVKVVFDPARVALTTVTRLYFDVIDPFSLNRQGNDQGRQYRTGRYFDPASPWGGEQEEAFRKVMGEVAKYLGRTSVVEVEALKNFYPAEDYHQNYLEKNLGGYCHISPAKIANVATRQKFIDRVYTLSPLQFSVTQEADTEQPFANEYDQTFDPGIYVDIVSGKPLFASTSKYDSGCGWPAFGKPINPDDLVEIPDHQIPGRPRTEVRVKDSGIHLGHVFTDGPAEFHGVRYCMNSASLRFIPLARMEAEGYADYISLVTDQGEA